MYRIEQYTPSHYNIWNEFVSNSKNGTFLFHRDFMEYHKERFNDLSLMVYNGDKLIALLPAHVSGDRVYSHQGLTYGGLVFNARAKQTDVMAVYRCILFFLKERNIKIIYLKPVPAIYHKFPAQEQEYVLFLLNAKLVRRDGLCVIAYSNRFPVIRSRKEAVKRGFKHKLKIVEEPNFELFWNEILIPNLKHKHGVKPVHTVEEIQYLHSMFPERIRHFNVYNENKIVGGTTMFLTDTVAHPQYISGQEDKNKLGTLDYLYSFLIGEFSDKRYFDFGPSTEEQGRKLNEGLLFWKESFGARTIVQDFYEVDTNSYILLDNVII